VRPAPRLPSIASGPVRRNDGAAAFAETAPGDFGAAERRSDAPPADRTGPAPADAMPAMPRAPVEPPRATLTGNFAVTPASQHTDAPAPRPGSHADRRVEHADRSVADDRPRRARPETAGDNTSSDVSGRHGLVPQAPVAPRIATRLARSRPAGDPSEARLAASPAPDVHIHIGRVELTAITPAAPARRESAANSKKPMSLEEYLRRRSGRPS
jgi:hypothetical protein